MHGNHRETARTIDILEVTGVSQKGRKTGAQAIIRPCIKRSTRFVPPLLPCRKNPVILSPHIVDDLDLRKTRREHTVEIQRLLLVQIGEVLGRDENLLTAGLHSPLQDLVHPTLEKGKIGFAKNQALEIPQGIDR